MFYLTTHSTHFIYGYMASVIITNEVIAKYICWHNDSFMKEKFIIPITIYLQNPV